MRAVDAFLILLGGAWCALAAHEAGHLLAGRFVGFRFGFFALGPVWLARVGPRVRLRWNRLPAAWGGMALAYPVDTRSLSARLAFCAAGGPLASLGLAAVAFALAKALPAPAIESRLAMAVAIMSASVFVATAQPFGTGVGVRSDGGRILFFATNRKKADAEAALVALMGQAAAGVRPRDWDPSLVRTAETIRSPAAVALEAKTSILRHHLDQGNRPQAEAIVDSLLAGYDAAPAATRGEAAAEIAFFLAFFRRDAAAARRYLKDARTPLAERHRLLRAEAAVHLRSSARAEAVRAVEGAEAALEQALVEVTDLDRDLVAAVRQEVSDLSGEGIRGERDVRRERGGER
ncbi:MAG TPA: hypothetical protein VF363_06835 [Candidatus Eisenbacteria bacterium]